MSQETKTQEMQGLQLLGFSTPQLGPWLGLDDVEGDDVYSKKALVRMQPEHYSVAVKAVSKVRVLAI
jgi:hypothetical protein